MTNTVRLDLVATKTKIAVGISVIDYDNVRVLQPSCCCKGVSHSNGRNPKDGPTSRQKCPQRSKFTQTQG